MSGFSIKTNGVLRATLCVAALLTLQACSEGQMPAFLQAKPQGDEVSRGVSTETGFGGTTERDVEAPDIFAANEAGLWDGRPSLGGVWIAHPDVKEPERGIIRNEANGKFVIGALFRKERQTPGPRLQVSSDAAAALGMLAGAPTNLDVVALRREEVTAAPEPLTPATAIASEEAAGTVPAAPAVTEGALDPVLDSASRALDAAPAATRTAAVTPAVATAPKPASKPRSAIAKPFIQIGIFSVEQNAKNTATAMRQAGLIPTVKPGKSNGKPFWRVVVGPAQTADERGTLLKTIKDTGFEDAYAVTD